MSPFTCQVPSCKKSSSHKKRANCDDCEVKNKKPSPPLFFFKNPR